MQDSSDILLPSTQPEEDIYDNASKEQVDADLSVNVAPHESSQRGQDLLIDSSSHAVHNKSSDESSEAVHSKTVTDSTQPNASGPEKSSSFEQKTLDSKVDEIRSHTLQDLYSQVDSSDQVEAVHAQGEGASNNIQPQSDLEMSKNDDVDREVEKIDHTNSPLQEELSPQSISVNDSNRDTAEYNKKGMATINNILSACVLCSLFH